MNTAESRSGLPHGVLRAFDHLVLTVSDLEATVAFYRDVLGMTPVEFGPGRLALHFGRQKINLHPAGAELAPHARRPVPGAADLCLLSDLSAAAWLSRLETHAVEVLDGPVRRTGAEGDICSLYIRDPDGNLLEIASYLPVNAVPAALEIVSGGQTGVDRGALEAALATGVPCGGWCPRGREAEDGPIPERYPLRELDGGYEQRTRRNVEDSDGTLIVYFGELEGGTEFTLDCCLRLRRPYHLVDATETSCWHAARRANGFVVGQGVRRLNVAGPRASRQPHAHAYTRRTLELLLAGSSS